VGVGVGMEMGMGMGMEGWLDPVGVVRLGF